MTAKNDAEALKDYMEAYKKYNGLLDEYFLVSAVVPGQEMQLGKSLTPEVLSELDKLADEVERKRKIWMKFLR